MMLRLFSFRAKNSGYRVSRVRKGNHDFDSQISATFCPKIRVEVFIPAGSDYFIEGENRWDLNKSPGLMKYPHPHIKSARGGWRIIDGKIEHTPYIYTSWKKRTYLKREQMPVFNQGEWFWYEIEDTGGEWKYTYSSGEVFSFPKRKSWLGLYFLGGWFFGGNEPAPRDLLVIWKLNKC